MLPDSPRIGLVEDDEIMGLSILQRLELEGRTVHWWQSGSQAVETVSAMPDELDLIVCDIRLPDISGEQVFKRLACLSGCPPFLFITAHADIDQAVRLMRAGAADFLTKPFAMEEFLRRVDASGRPQRRPEADIRGKLGESAAMGAVEDMLARYANHAMPVLITGETGAGKEVAARLLHQISSRASEPFMAVNCAAIPAELLESEVFGHERGAFTGAHQRHVGYAERARGGTLFLDEIGDMPVPLQAKILRLLEDGSFHRVGGEFAIPFRARVVAATHRNLAPGSGGSNFREDLFYRLAVLPVELPPLRERSEDVVWLMDQFLDEALTRSDARLRGFSTMATEAALAHRWSGNVRELRNRVERAVAVSNGEWIMPGDLFPELGPSVQWSAEFASLSTVRDAAERRQIERALRETEGRIARAAKLLGVSRTTLWEKMSRHGLADRWRSDS